MAMSLSWLWNPHGYDLVMARGLSWPLLCNGFELLQNFEPAMALGLSYVYEPVVAMSLSWL